MFKLTIPALLFASTIAACSTIGPINEAQTKITEVDSAEAVKFLATETDGRRPVVIDIRTPEEFAGGHIAGARNINFSSDDFEARLAELDRSQPYLLHCRSGRRSGESLDTFAKLGFENIHHLKGGILEWEAAGLELEK